MTKLNKWQRFKVWLGFHIHEPKIFCAGQYAFVKCMTCRAESIPWLVSKVHADEWAKNNPNWAAELNAIDQKRFK